MNIKYNSYLTTKEAADNLGISRATVINWIKLGKLPGIKNDEIYLIPKKAVAKVRKALPSSSLLQSRRNKSLSEKNFIPGSYIDKHSPNYKTIKKLLSNIAKKNISVSVNALIAHYAESMLKECGISGEYADVLLSDFGSDLSIQSLEASDYPLSYIEGEDTLGMLYISLRRLRDKKSKGAYYTPFYVVDKCLEEIGDTGSKRIIDPACGTGNFLIRLSKNTNLENIYGCDIDPVSISIARINLALKYKVSSKKELYTIMKNITVTDFLNSGSLPGKGFDAVIGNPPWGYSFNPSEIKKLRKAFPFLKAHQKPESFSLFLEKGIEVLKDGGLLTYLLPETLLGSDIYRSVRERLLSACHVTSLSYLGDIFDKVQCPCIIFSSKKNVSGAAPEKVAGERPALGASQNAPKIKVSYYKKAARSMVKLQDFSCSPGRLNKNSFHILCDDREYALVQKIRSCDHFTLKGNAEFALGIVTGNNEKLLSSTCKKGFEPIIKGSDINPYRIATPTNFIAYEPDKFQQCAEERFYRAKERLLYKFICSKPIFAYDDTGLLSLNSANILIPKAEGYSALYIMCVLNSPVIRYYYKNSFKNMKVLRSAIEALPIPNCDDKVMKKISLLAKDKMRSGCDDFSDIDKTIAGLYNLSDADYKHILTVCKK